MMVGMTGLEVLNQIKNIDPSIPVVMATKNEEESLMEQAIGKKIDDYLTKPINPTQVLLVCKKFLEGERINKEVFTQDYLQGFSQITSKLFSPLNWKEWTEIYVQLTKWSLDINKLKDLQLQETLQGKWMECNQEFSRFIESNYLDWINHPDKERDDDYPIMSPHILDQYLLPAMKNQDNRIYFIVIDCMRYDQ